VPSPAAGPADPAPIAVVTAPIVAGAAHDAEAAALEAAAAELGVAVVSRHAVGRGRWLLQLSASRRLLTNGSAGGGLDEKLAVTSGEQIAVGEAVATLRQAGFAVLAGPPSEAYAVVWGRRNGPSWFAPEAFVCFPWSPVDRSAARLAVEIDPGAGFGAGGHPTTLGLLAGLVDPAVVDAPAAPGNLADLSGRRVLDVGCGTGVLAIAAALRGAALVDALDIAPAALDATRANAIRNGVADRVHLVDADLARCPGPYDLVLANIHADVITALATELRRLVSRPVGAAGPGADPEPPAPGGGGGLLGVSGLSVAQVSRLEAALAPLRTVHRHHLDDWVTLWFRW